MSPGADRAQAIPLYGLPLLAALLAFNSTYAGPIEAQVSAVAAALMGAVWLARWVWPEWGAAIYLWGFGVGALALALAALLVTLSMHTYQLPTSMVIVPLTIPLVCSFWALAAPRSLAGPALSTLYMLLAVGICWRVWALGYREIHPLLVLIFGLMFVYNAHAGMRDANTSAAQQARHEEREKARVDPLTGLLGRQAFNEDFLQGGFGPPDLNLLILDIDHFKAVNDKHGHNVGDQVLAQVAGLMRSEAGEHGRLYRWGGEEFVILQGGRLTDAARLAETLRARVEESAFEVGRITVSIGCGAVRVGQSRSLAFNRVDRALRSAKQGGRNRVALVEEAPG